ncbi:MAG TPA: TonB-dependent receptor, partial [Sphingomicrobium sp.]|nr:TonB-dependent receptor [Sphingomicrobium sp.]
ADTRFTSGESRELYAFDDGEPTRRRVAGGESRTLGLFAEASIPLGQLTLSGGGRIDHWRISDGQLIERPIGGEPSRIDLYRARSGWRPTARAGAVYDLGEGVSLRSAAYLGWRWPTLNELFRPLRAGAVATAANPLLDPERLAGAETGLRYDSDGLTLSLSGFLNRLSDSIANVTLGHGPGTFPGVGFVAGDYRQRQNIDAVKVRGLEASGELRRRQWSLRLGASYNDARVQASGAAARLDGLRPAQTPKLSLSGELGWSDGAKAASLAVRHVGAQYEDDLNSMRLPPATTVDAFFAWPLTGRMQLIARGQNLLGERVVAGIDDDGIVERATPRTLWIGLRIGAF